MDTSSNNASPQSPRPEPQDGGRRRWCERRAVRRTVKAFKALYAFLNAVRLLDLVVEFFGNL